MPARDRRFVEKPTPGGFRTLRTGLLACARRWHILRSRAGQSSDSGRQGRRPAAARVALIRTEVGMFQVGVVGSTGSQGLTSAAGIGLLAAIVVIVTAVGTTLLMLWGLGVVRRLDRHSQHRVDDALTQLSQAKDETAPHSHSSPDIPRDAAGWQLSAAQPTGRRTDSGAMMMPGRDPRRLVAAVLVLVCALASHRAHADPPLSSLGRVPDVRRCGRWGRTAALPRIRAAAGYRGVPRTWPGDDCPALRLRVLRSQPANELAVFGRTISGAPSTASARSRPAISLPRSAGPR